MFAGADQVSLVEFPEAVEVRWAWLAPVMGCFLAMMVLTSSHTSHLGLGRGDATNWLNEVVADQNYAAYLCADFHSEQNALQKDPIEWTNGPRVPAEPISVTFPATNLLIREPQL